jgi:geranylgeranyl pyrophosphate synthase
MRIGAIVANGDDRDLGRFNRFGYLLGLAFRITDDILNLKGNVTRYGKEIDGDLWEGKRTLLLMHAFGMPIAPTARGSAASRRDRVNVAFRARCCGSTRSWLAAAASSGCSKLRPPLHMRRSVSSTAQHSLACLQVLTSHGSALA